MFRVYHSNQLSKLKDLIAALMAQDTLPPFEQEVVLVQSPGMAQWLQIVLAQQLGVAANISFPLPATFIWDMFTRVLPGIPKESAFSKDAMMWKLLWLLPGKLAQPEFAPLQHYLADDGDKRKIHQLAARIADLFDQYLVYRPQWRDSTALSFGRHHFGGLSVITPRSCNSLAGIVPIFTRNLLKNSTISNRLPTCQNAYLSVVSLRYLRSIYRH